MDQLAENFPIASGGQGSFIFEAPNGEQIDAPENIEPLLDTINEIYNLNYVINPMEIMQEQGQENGEDMQSMMAALPESNATHRPFMVNDMPVPGVIISEEGNLSLFSFQLTEQVDNLTESQLDKLINLGYQLEEDTSLTVLPSGTLTQSDIPIGGAEEIIGLIIAGVVLVVTLGSLVAAGLPLIIALMGVGIGVGGTYSLSNLFEINNLTPVLALMIGLAVGIDYALFIVNRQRKLILEE